MKKITLFCLLLLSLENIQGQSLIKIQVKANKLLFDRSRNLLYATASAQDSILGNQLVAIDARTGQIVNSLFVGSEPDAMSITYNYSHLYVGLDGATIVKKINLSSFVVESQINLGADNFFGGYFPYDLACINGRDDIVLVSRQWSGTSPANAGIAMYKNGTKLSLGTNNTDYSFDIEYDSDNGILYGYDSQTTGSKLTEYSVDTANGITHHNSVVVNLGLGMKYAHKTMFANSKAVVDLTASPPYQSGSFSYNNSVWGSWSAVDDSAKTYYIAQTSGNANVTVAYFNVATFMQKRIVTYSNTVPNASNYQVVGLVAIDTGGYGIIVKDTYNASFGNPAGWYVLLKADDIMGVKQWNGQGTDDISIFPSPFTSSFTVKPHSRLESFLVSVSNYSGDQLFVKEGSSSEAVPINLESYSRGLYFVQIKDLSNGLSVIRKVVKE